MKCYRDHWPWASLPRCIVSGNLIAIQQFWNLMHEALDDTITLLQLKIPMLVRALRDNPLPLASASMRCICSSTVLLYLAACPSTNAVSRHVRYQSEAIGYIYPPLRVMPFILYDRPRLQKGLQLVLALVSRLAEASSSEPSSICSQSLSQLQSACLNPVSLWVRMPFRI